MEDVDDVVPFLKKSRKRGKASRVGTLTILTSPASTAGSRHSPAKLTFHPAEEAKRRGKRKDQS